MATVVPFLAGGEGAGTAEKLKQKVPNSNKKGRSPIEIALFIVVMVVGFGY